MKYIITMFLFLPALAFGQKAIFLELGGNGGLASINYEMPVLKNLESDFNLRFGFSMSPVDKNNGNVLVFPVMFNGTLGKKHAFEYGIGQTFSVTTKGAFFIMGIAQAGYRYNFSSKPLFLRVNYTPIISYILDFQWQHWGGVSIGYYFGRTEQ